MVRVSANLMVAPVVLAMLFLLSTTTATVVEKMATTSEERPVMVVEEVVVMVEQPKNIDYNGNRKTKMMFMQPNSGGLDAQIIKEVTASNTVEAITKCGSKGDTCSWLWKCCTGLTCVSGWEFNTCE